MAALILPRLSFVFLTLAKLHCLRIWSFPLESNRTLPFRSLDSLTCLLIHHKCVWEALPLESWPTPGAQCFACSVPANLAYLRVQCLLRLWQKEEPTPDLSPTYEPIIIYYSCTHYIYYQYLRMRANRSI